MSNGVTVAGVELGAADLDMLDHVERFVLPSGHAVARRGGRGEDRWAVIAPGSQSVLNVAGYFEYEPLPSSRTDEFIARTRFPLAEAVAKVRACGYLDRNGHAR